MPTFFVFSFDIHTPPKTDTPEVEIEAQKRKRMEDFISLHTAEAVAKSTYMFEGTGTVDEHYDTIINLMMPLRAEDKLIITLTNEPRCYPPHIPKEYLAHVAKHVPEANQ